MPSYFCQGKYMSIISFNKFTTQENCVKYCAFSQTQFHADRIKTQMTIIQQIGLPFTVSVISVTLKSGQSLNWYETENLKLNGSHNHAKYETGLAKENKADNHCLLQPISLPLTKNQNNKTCCLHLHLTI